MNICQQLISEVINAESIDALGRISDKANEIFLSDGNKEMRDLMTDDFWIEFTKMFRKRVMQLERQ